MARGAYTRENRPPPTGPMARGGAPLQVGNPRTAPVDLAAATARLAASRRCRGVSLACRKLEQAAASASRPAVQRAVPCAVQVRAGCVAPSSTGWHRGSYHHQRQIGAGPRHRHGGPSWKRSARTVIPAPRAPRAPPAARTGTVPGLDRGQCHAAVVVVCALWALAPHAFRKRLACLAAADRTRYPRVMYTYSPMGS